MINDEDKITLFLNENHKTTKNIRAVKVVCSPSRGQ